jgi:heme/copper-type cytochrome/quinol oxidase subunit 3
MSARARVHPSQTQPARTHLRGTGAAQGSPSPEHFDRLAPSGVSESHPILREKIRLAVLLFLVSEFVFFVFLIVAYIYSQPSEISGPTAHSSLVPWKTGIYTVLLLLSSFTIYLAERSLDKNRKRFVLWMGVTILLGGTFLFGEMREYSGLLQKSISISRNLFGSTYFTLTGFHAIHVTLGVLMLMTVTGLIGTGKLKEKRHTAFKAVSYYWHFVDLVWVMVFCVVYLWSAR